MQMSTDHNTSKYNQTQDLSLYSESITVQNIDTDPKCCLSVCLRCLDLSISYMMHICKHTFMLFCCWRKWWSANIYTKQTQFMSNRKQEGNQTNIFNISSELFPNQHLRLMCQSITCTLNWGMPTGTRTKHRELCFHCLVDCNKPSHNEANRG